jgi:large subunit ribosomal protein L31
MLVSRQPVLEPPDPGAQRARKARETMKEGIHPNYREVVFLDTSCDFGFVTRSTVSTSETIKWKDGKEYPCYKIEISAESHPFYTGKQKIVDTAGRVDKFKKRYARKSATPS